MDAATYWQLRYRQAESEAAAARAALAETLYRAALREAGIDPAVPHRWDDVTCSLIRETPQESGRD